MTGTTTDLAQWRETMRQHRVNSVGTQAVYFDGSPTGAGKSTADIAAIAVAKNSISFLPSHSQCQELVDTLAANGISAAAYPPLDATTCQIYGPPEKPGVAQIAQRSGLSVGEAICPECPYQKGCDYQRRREASRHADHVVATHARAASSGFEAAAGKEMIFIHEDAISLLRPTLRAASVSALLPVIIVARTLKEIAERLGDDEKVGFAAALIQSTSRLVDILAEDSMLLASQQDPTAPKVRPVPLRDPLRRPPRLDMVLFQAVKASAVRLDGDALRLAVAYCCGELDQLCLMVDERFLKGGARERTQVIVGTAKVEPPLDAAVWFEDATGDPALISSLLGRPIEDRTPAGSLPRKTRCVQIPEVDLKKTTLPGVARSVVRGLLAANPSASRVGIITLTEHVQTIDQLEPFWRDRIHRIDYFYSGNDRGSNRWMDCDLLLIVGTPRVPPDAVRRHLVQIGQVEHSGQDGGWSKTNWPASPFCDHVIDSLGYTNEFWDAANKRLVRAALLQAAGRARSILESGVPVIVVSNEDLALQLDVSPFRLIADCVANTFGSFTELAADFSNIYNIEFSAANSLDNAPSLRSGAGVVSSKQVAERSGQSARTVREHLLLLEQCGLIVRVGKRGGYRLAQLPEQKHD